MADDLQQHFLCLLFTLCVFASTVRFLGNNPAAGTGSGAGGWLVVSHRVTAVIASRKRPVPFRTRKLSSIAPMVLHSGGCGRVGRRRTSSLGVEECLNPFSGVRLLHSLFSCPGSVRTTARVLAPRGHGQKHLRRLAPRRGAVMGADRPVFSVSAMRDSSVLRHVHRCTELKGYVSPTTDDPLGTSRSGELSTVARGGGFAVSRTMLRTCRAYGRPPGTDLQGGRPDGSLRCQAPRESPSVVATSRWLSRAH